MCMYCKCNDLIESTTTHVVNYKGCVIIVKNVPCEECDQCGAKYYSDETARQLEKLVNTAKSIIRKLHRLMIKRYFGISFSYINIKMKGSDMGNYIYQKPLKILGL